MTRKRDVWFQHGLGNTRTPVHADGWRAIRVLVGGLGFALVLAIIASVVGAGPGWTLIAMAIALVVPAWFLINTRGRTRFEIPESSEE